MRLRTATQFPQQVFNDKLYEIYYRFLETEDEYFDYAPAKIPPQGRWRIYGINLPDSILRKVYNENAARLLQITSRCEPKLRVVLLGAAVCRRSGAWRRCACGKER